DGLLFFQRVGRTCWNFDLFSRALADNHVVDLAGVGNDLLVHLVTCGANRVTLADVPQGDDRDFCRTTGDVDDHAARGVHDRQPGTDRGSHRLLDQVGLAGAGVEGGVVDGALLNLGDTAGDADDDAGPRDAEAIAFVDRTDEVVEHALRDVKVGNDAVFER